MIGREELAVMLFKNGHIKLIGPENKIGFRFKFHEKYPGAPLSPSYFSLRNLGEEILLNIAQLLNKIVLDEKIEFNRIAGIPRAGDPIAKAFAEAIGQSNKLIFLKKEEEVGKRRIAPYVFGEFQEREVVLLFDDLISKGHTKIEGICAVRGNGLTANDLVVIIDRQQGGIEEMAKLGVKVRFLLTLDEILEIYIKEKFITEEMKKRIISYPDLVEEYIKKRSGV